MALINSKKRKLAEDTHSATFLIKTHKRHHSDHAPLSSIDDQAAMELRDRKTASGKTSRPSADQALSLKPMKVGQSKNFAQKQKVSNSSPSSLDEGGLPIAEPIDTDADAASKLAPDAASTSLSEEVSSEGDGAAEEDEENSDSKPHPDNKKREAFKADDPGAFASSMSAILGSKLTKAQRENPILVRSAHAKEADEALLDLKLEKEARREMRREKKELEKHGMGMQPDGEGARDTMGDAFRTLDVDNVGSVSAHQQREKELRKMAEKGVIKMFNAFTHAREKTAEVQGLAGSRAKKEEKATEMTKEGWLEFVGHGGQGKVQE